MGELDDKLAELRAQREAMEAQLAELRRLEREQELAIREESKRREAEKPIIVKAIELAGAFVVTHSDFREDLLEVFRRVPGRQYRGSMENMLPMKEWDTFVERATALVNVTVEIDAEMKDQMEKILHAPKFFIDLRDERFITITPGPYVPYQFLINKFEGVKLDKQTFLVPLSEAWRVPAAFDITTPEWQQPYEDADGTYHYGKYVDKVTGSMEGVVYSEAAEAYISKLIRARAELDVIAAKEANPDISARLREVGFLGILRGFQECGVEFLELADGNVILADQVGLGKTWQALAYAQLAALKKILIVCPASIKPNWVHQIRERLGENALALSGGDPTLWAAEIVIRNPRFIVINYDILGKRIEETELVQSKFATYEKKSERWPWVDFLKLLKFDLIVFDEAHYIKNTSSHRSKAARMFVEAAQPPHVIPMTGSPVTNRPKELWPILKLVAPVSFESEDRFLRRYASRNGLYARNVEELHNLIKHIFIRRKKKDVQKSLPPINRMYDYHELSPKAQRLYNKALAGVYEAIAEYNPYGQGGNEMKIMSILALLQRLKMICAIDKVDQTAELVTDIIDSLEGENGHSKVLVYSQYKGAAYAIYSRLRELGALCFVERKVVGKRATFETADYDERFELIQRFQNDPSIRVLVATSHALREGLDVTAAGVVVWNDLLWTPAAHEQGEGRAYGRLGDEHGIDARYIVAEDTIEDDIQAILARKQQMIDEMVEGVEKSREADTSIATELIEKLRQRKWNK